MFRNSFEPRPGYREIAKRRLVDAGASGARRRQRNAFLWQASHRRPALNLAAIGGICRECQLGDPGKPRGAPATALVEPHEPRAFAAGLRGQRGEGLARDSAGAEPTPVRVTAMNCFRELRFRELDAGARAERQRCQMGGLGGVRKDFDAHQASERCGLHPHVQYRRAAAHHECPAGWVDDRKSPVVVGVHLDAVFGEHETPRLRVVNGRR